MKYDEKSLHTRLQIKDVVLGNHQNLQHHIISCIISFHIIRCILSVQKIHMFSTANSSHSRAEYTTAYNKQS